MRATIVLCSLFLFVGCSSKPGDPVVCSSKSSSPEKPASDDTNPVRCRDSNDPKLELKLYKSFTRMADYRVGEPIIIAEILENKSSETVYENFRSFRRQVYAVASYAMIDRDTGEELGYPDEAVPSEMMIKQHLFCKFILERRLFSRSRF